MFEYIDGQFMCGGRHESHMEGLVDEIKSKDIVSFMYSGEFYLGANKENGIVHIYTMGGGKYNKRDGSYFIVKYDTEDDSIFNKLQEVIDKYQVSRNNGYCLHVDGLPGGIGDNIDVKYSSNERIYKISNQAPTISQEAAKEFYDIFHEYVKKEGFDFTSEGSNVQLFDDADEEYLQGTWKGKHFGYDIEVTFKDNKVTIKVDDKVVEENTEYIIKDGFVQKNKLLEGKDGSTKYDYEDFEGVNSFAKKNWFTMTAYFTKESYSTCDLMNFDKEKPKNME